MPGGRVNVTVLAVPTAVTPAEPVVPTAVRSAAEPETVAGVPSVRPNVAVPVVAPLTVPLTVNTKPAPLRPTQPGLAHVQVTAGGAVGIREDVELFAPPGLAQHQCMLDR